MGKMTTNAAKDYVRTIEDERDYLVAERDRLRAEMLELVSALEEVWAGAKGDSSDMWERVNAIMSKHKAALAPQ